MMDFSVQTVYIDRPIYEHAPALAAVLLALIVAFQLARGGIRRIRRASGDMPRGVRIIHVLAVALALIQGAAAVFSFVSDLGEVNRYEAQTHQATRFVRAAITNELRINLAIALALTLLTSASAAVWRRSS